MVSTNDAEQARPPIFDSTEFYGRELAASLP
jgi:hypothetical protein